MSSTTGIVETKYKQAGYPKGFSTGVEFTRHYGLVHSLTPFAKWCSPELDTFGEFRAAREFIDGLPRTAASFSTRTLFSDTVIDSGQHRRIHPQLIALGAWRLGPPESWSWSSRYGNPSYVHPHTLDTIDDPDHRREHVETAASFGIADADVLAPAFGVESMKDATYRIDGIVWEDLRREGRKDMCRTISVAREWLDRTISGLCDDLGLPLSTYNEWCQRYDLYDFEVPTDPCTVYDAFPRK